MSGGMAGAGGWASPRLQPAFAVKPDEMLDDPALEARARALSEELRCLVCQNQSIDDSDAPLAHDLRVLLRERLTAGDTDEQVIDFLVARYGEFILLKPRFNGHTWLLWLVPPGVLLIGAAAAGIRLARGAESRRRRRRRSTSRKRPNSAGCCPKTAESRRKPPHITEI